MWFLILCVCWLPGNSFDVLSTPWTSRVGRFLIFHYRVVSIHYFFHTTLSYPFCVHSSLNLISSVVNVAAQATAGWVKTEELKLSALVCLSEKVSLTEPDVKNNKLITHLFHFLHSPAGFYHHVRIVMFFSCFTFPVVYIFPAAVNHMFHQSWVPAICLCYFPVLSCALLSHVCPILPVEIPASSFDSIWQTSLYFEDQITELLPFFKQTSQVFFSFKPNLISMLLDTGCPPTYYRVFLLFQGHLTIAFNMAYNGFTAIHYFFFNWTYFSCRTLVPCVNIEDSKMYL